LISGGLAGGQGSQGTTQAPILLVKAIQMQCPPNTRQPRHVPQAAVWLNGGARTFVTATSINTTQSSPKLYTNTWQWLPTLYIKILIQNRRSYLSYSCRHTSGNSVS